MPSNLEFKKIKKIKETRREKKKIKKIVSLGIEPRTFPEHLLRAIVNGKS
jgi:predicted metal-dependent TIM-barrel fold hydrolase